MVADCYEWSVVFLEYLDFSSIITLEMVNLSTSPSPSAIILEKSAKSHAASQCHCQ